MTFKIGAGKRIDFSRNLWRNLQNMHRNTAMGALSGPVLGKKEVSCGAVHSMTTTTTVKGRSVEMMEEAFLSLINFDPAKHNDIFGFTNIYRRIGSDEELYLNIAMTIAEGVSLKDYWGLTFSDGMRAINSLLEFRTKAGDEFIVAKPLYACTDNYFDGPALENRGFKVNYVDFTNPENIREFLNPKTKTVYFETATNPNVRVYDLEAIAKIVKEYKEINSDILIIVDNTFPSPAGFNPLLHGADIVVHSATKSLGGFLQEMLGEVILPKKLWKDLFLWRKNTGGVSSPQQIHPLLTRGLPSLYIRFAQMQKNAIEIARYLEGSNKIKQVNYPGLENYKYYNNAKKMFRDWDGNFSPGYMLAFIADGKDEAERSYYARRVVNYIAEHGMDIITSAVSLGGHKSLIENPFVGTHATVTAEEKEKWGVDEGMLRFSTGLGHYGDILQLLETAIQYAYKVHPKKT